MYLTRLIYVSTLSAECDQQALDEILQISRVNNQKNHLTGLLSHNNRYFLQCIEGARAKVNEAYNRILSDPRHSRVVILQYQEITEREFGDWSMGEIPQCYLTALLNLQFSGSSEFLPYDLTGESAYRMLRQLKQKLPSE
ncbi:hypothetical protein VST7929_03068 [Vibrio stylophorae]|uniref:BLUF domain-containing protein n=1 Tax=Vibrio stylophorae TaxID=659351 RepID=A0ABM8ZXM2_9VIBR|nr:BLUF domain-containing protein [Vibrio stylophorae]CAH0535498.1 hypothetical protein VST7929_03068 [Vibrio stylophorae]